MKNLDFKPKCGGGDFCLSKNKPWFTLVELIIVVVIIAILATIAFLTLGQYPQEARDVKRLSDKNNIEKALEIYRAQKGSYPKFDTYEWKTVFWTGALNELNGTISTLPRDPLTKKPYTIQLQENQVDRTTTARVIIEAGESRYTNWKLAQNWGITNPTTTVTPPVENTTNTELEAEKTKLRNRIAELKNVDTIWKTPESINAFNTKITEAENLLNKTWVTKQEITNKINELADLEKTLVSNTCVRDIRGRFKVNWQVITDTRTGLVWSKETKNTWVNWHQAKEYCANLTTWWKTNWRLPDKTELISIENDRCYGPDTDYHNVIYSEFDTVEPDIYWSSTVYSFGRFPYLTNNTEFVWIMSFHGGESAEVDKTDNHYVLCVSDPE